MGGTPAQCPSASQTPPCRWGWPPPTFQARKEGPGMADSGSAHRAKRAVGSRNPGQPCWALGALGQLGGEGCGLQDGICTRFREVTDGSPTAWPISTPVPTPSSSGVPGGHSPRVHTRRGGGQVCRRSVGWVLLGDSRWRRDSQVLPHPHPKSAPRKVTWTYLSCHPQR